ncbi:type II toxin-antitoxin system PemK/MazF family toxin [Vagococcus fluvialis]|uniref:type II toxin-antitoxin system PemK/MazF family toxin n=1 Tax=Vagococcus fluvialis TaxID=2738 RepID=UPI003D144E8B
MYFIDFGTLGFEGSEQGGTRPGLILQNYLGNHFSNITTVALISKSTRKNFPTHVRLDHKKYPFIKEGSTIMLEQVRKISQTRLTGKLGSLSEDEMLEVEQKLKVSFGMC